MQKFVIRGSKEFAEYAENNYSKSLYGGGNNTLFYLIENDRIIDTSHRSIWLYSPLLTMEDLKDEFIGVKFKTPTRGTIYTVFSLNKDRYTITWEDDEITYSKEDVIRYFKYKNWIKINNMKYTIEQLNTYIHKPVEANLVVHIKNIDDWNKLNAVCPTLVKYQADKHYYLPKGGISSTPYYNTIEMEDIQFEEETKEIIGYLAPMDLFENKVKKGCIYNYMKLYNGYLPDHGDKLDNKTAPTAVKLPKEIVELWEPVYKEVIKFKEIELGNPLRKFIIWKDKIKVITGSGKSEMFDNKHLITLNNCLDKVLYKIDNYDVKVSVVQIGCLSDGVALTKLDLETIKKIQSEL